MYVIRPLFFIPIITLLRNAAANSIQYKRQLVEYSNQNIDVTNFENKLLDFQNKFGNNVRLAKESFDTAFEEIDKTIDHLQKQKLLYCLPKTICALLMIKLKILLLKS